MSCWYSSVSHKLLSFDYSEEKTLHPFPYMHCNTNNKIELRLSVCVSACMWQKKHFFHVSIARTNEFQTSPNLQHMWRLVFRAVLNCLGQCTCPRTRTAHEIVHAIFTYFFVSFLTFWSLSLLKMKKKQRPHYREVSMRRTFLILFTFFHFSKAEICQKWSKFHIFDLWWQKYAT